MGPGICGHPYRAARYQRVRVGQAVQADELCDPAVLLPSGDAKVPGNAIEVVAALDHIDDGADSHLRGAGVGLGICRGSKPWCNRAESEAARDKNRYDQRRTAPESC